MLSLAKASGASDWLSRAFLRGRLELLESDFWWIINSYFRTTGLRLLSAMKRIQSIRSRSQWWRRIGSACLECRGLMRAPVWLHTTQVVGCPSRYAVGLMNQTGQFVDGEKSRSSCGTDAFSEVSFGVSLSLTAIASLFSGFHNSYSIKRSYEGLPMAQCLVTEGLANFHG